MRVAEHIKQILAETLFPTFIEVFDESHMHNVPKDAQSHFKVIVVSDRFKDKMKVARHQLVYGLVKDITYHALSMQTMTPEEWEKDDSIKKSPLCTKK